MHAQSKQRHKVILLRWAHSLVEAASWVVFSLLLLKADEGVVGWQRAVGTLCSVQSVEIGVREEDTGWL